MGTHPIADYSYRHILVLITALLLTITQAGMLWWYAEVDWFPAAIDGIATIGWFVVLAYLAWFVVGIISISKTNLIVVVVGILCWLAGSFVACYIMVKLRNISYISFIPTIPFRLLFGVPAWIAVILWYRLQTTKDPVSQDTGFVTLEEEKLLAQPEKNWIDRITVKDGARIHIIKTEEILYIQACGDYTTLVTATGEYIKEQTMKYFETNLPASNFVRIHRSSIVNVTQISRVELFGKETYQLLLKDGTKLRVSLTGYRLLKERLGI